MNGPSTLIRRAYGSAIVATVLARDRGVPYLPRPRLEARRDRRIRSMVAYAARHVPFYRELFAREGIDPAEIRTASDLDRLPLLDRERVRAHPGQFVAQTRAAEASLSFFTSGSTGTPIEIHHDRRSLLANIAYGEREREPVNRACGTFRPRELYVGYETSTFKKVMAFYEQAVMFPVRPRRRFVSILESPDRIAAIANEELPDVLVGYGGWIDRFFKTVAARGIKMHIPKLVMYMGEALPHGGRTFIQEQFGIPVMSRYNAVESFKIGFYCEHPTGFHVHEDLCHVRIAGPDGTSLPDGRQGQIVISNLVNRGSVLLNYPIGDVGSISAESCPCGRTLRLLSELEGRVEDILELPGQRFIHPRAVWQAVKDDRELLQYQLIQVEPEKFELSLVTLDDAAYQRVLARAMPQLQALLGPGSRIDVHRNPDMVRSERGKFRAVSSRCKPAPEQALVSGS